MSTINQSKTHVNVALKLQAPVLLRLCDYQHCIEEKHFTRLVVVEEDALVPQIAEHSQFYTYGGRTDVSHGDEMIRTDKLNGSLTWSQPPIQNTAELTNATLLLQSLLHLINIAAQFQHLLVRLVHL